MRDAHVRQYLLLELKTRSDNIRFQSKFVQLEKLNQSDIKKIEDSMLVRQNKFLGLKESWVNNENIGPYFELLNPDPLRVLEVFALSYSRSYHAFNTSMESSDPALLHEWRKRLKDVQYQYELLYGNLNSDIQKYYPQIQELCNVLGKLNDYDMMNRWLRDNQINISDKDNSLLMITEQIIKQQEALLSDAGAEGLKLYAFSPDQFNEQLFCQIQ